jgi:hypothetical protein
LPRKEIVFGETRVAGVAVRRERDPVAIRRPCRPKIPGWVVSEVNETPAGEVQYPDVRLPAAARHEGQALAIGRESRLVVEGRIVDQAFEARAIRMSTVDIRRPIAAGSEDHPFAVV